MKIKLTEEQIKRILESMESEEVVCANCDWSWNTNDSEDFDKYICHKCGHDNKK